MPERGDLLLAEGGTGGDRTMESAVQHGTATFVAGLSATGTASHLAAATGAWRYGKRSAFPTSPHPRRRRRTASPPPAFGPRRETPAPQTYLHRGSSGTVPGGPIPDCEPPNPLAHPPAIVAPHPV